MMHLYVYVLYHTFYKNDSGYYITYNILNILVSDSAELMEWKYMD